MVKKHYFQWKVGLIKPLYWPVGGGIKLGVCLLSLEVKLLQLNIIKFKYLPIWFKGLYENHCFIFFNLLLRFCSQNGFRFIQFNYSLLPSLCVVWASYNWFKKQEIKMKNVCCVYINLHRGYIKTREPGKIRIKF